MSARFAIRYNGKYLALRVDMNSRGRGHIGGYWVDTPDGATWFPEEDAYGLAAEGWGAAIALGDAQ